MNLRCVGGSCIAQDLLQFIRNITKSAINSIVGDIYKVNVLVFQIQWHSGDKIASWWKFKAQKAQSVIFW